MTTKFTPGPWHAVNFIEGENGNLIDDHYNAIMAGIGFNDAETGEVGFEISGCISRADAELMAAAPEMYAALVAMVNDSAFAELCAGIGEEPEWLRAARSALAKAKGGAA